MITNRGDALGDSYAPQARAIIEYPIANRGYAFGYTYAHQARATIERIIANRDYAFTDSHTRQAIAIFKRTRSNHLGSIANLTGSDTCACSLNKYKIRTIVITQIMPIIILIVYQACAIIERRRVNRGYTFGDAYIR